MMSAPSQPRVCDACHSRKVRCDRKTPCGNCQDQNVSCTRTRDMKRFPKRTYAEMRRGPSEQPVGGEHALQHVPASGGLLDPLQDLLQPEDSTLVPSFPDQTGEVERLNIPMAGPSGLFDNFNIDYKILSWMSFVPLTDAHITNQHRPDHSHDLAWNRRQALETALIIASQLSGGMADCAESSADSVIVQDQGTTPSFEFLYWMLKDIGTDKFGLFVQDYFRHVGKSTLKHMGLSILYKTASPLETLLYTVCVNSVAYKFLKTILETETDHELANSLRDTALRYRETAQAALKRIPLLTKPSLTLLQATLCGIFLHQGSGDGSICWELAKTACRICMDMDLCTTTAGLQKATEEEYYCFMWCYVLDRNYAWKLGRPRYLVVDPDVDFRPAASSTSASELITIYLDLARVQDRMIPFLNNHSNPDRENPSNFHEVGPDLLHRMERIRSNIHEITLPSPEWKGLDSHSEIAALDFAFHSIMTTIFHLLQVAPGQTRPVGPSADHYLGSARQELLALISICAANDASNAAAYLHWTLLYYPLTACFALFCNAIATSHTGDFQILAAVANCLANTGSTSQAISTMQNLFREFVALARCFFIEPIESIDSVEGGGGGVDGEGMVSSVLYRGSLGMVPGWGDGGLSLDVV